jgi:hypothetical protein
MLKILSLQDFNLSSDNLMTGGFMYNRPVYCTKEELQQETEPFAAYLHDFPIISITPEMLATRETARTIGARDLFLPVQDSSFKKIANIWREKGLLEAIKSAANENPDEITYPVHWLVTR